MQALPMHSPHSAFTDRHVPSQVLALTVSVVLGMCSCASRQLDMHAFKACTYIHASGPPNTYSPAHLLHRLSGTTAVAKSRCTHTSKPFACDTHMWSSQRMFRNSQHHGHKSMAAAACAVQAQKAYLYILSCCTAFPLRAVNMAKDILACMPANAQPAAALANTCFFWGCPCTRAELVVAVLGNANTRTPTPC